MFFREDMTIINTCRERNIEGVGVGTRIAHPSAQELVEDMIVPTPAMRRENQPIELLVDGFAHGTSGFAVTFRDWVRHLVKYGVHVYVPPTQNSEYPEIVKLHETEVEHPIELRIVPSCAFPPKTADRFTIGVALFETDTFPTFFRDNAENVDLLWVCSQFCYDRLAAVGVAKDKMEIFPLGVDTELFNPFVQPSQKKDGTFRIGSIMGWSARKGVHILLRAFLEEFDISEKVELFISGGWYAQKVAQEEVNQVKKGLGKANYPKITLDWDDRSDWEMPALYNSFDCFALPTLGEGYNRTVVEALSCAIPTISTDYPPTSEVLNARNGYPIEVEKIAPEPRADWICDYYKGADFAHPSEEHLRMLMREVFTHPEEAKAKAVKGREDIKNNHNTAWIIEDIVKRLREIR